MPDVGDIYYVQIQWRNCNDRRPCVIIGKGETYLVLLISGQMDLYDPTKHFLFDPEDPDFPAMGLTRKCYAASDECHEIGAQELLSHKGKLKGFLLTKFLKWNG